MTETHLIYRRIWVRVSDSNFDRLRESSVSLLVVLQNRLVREQVEAQVVVEGQCHYRAYEEINQ